MYKVINVRNSAKFCSFYSICGHNVLLLLTTRVTVCFYPVMSDPAPDKWLTIDEAVEYLRSKGVTITRGTLYTNVSRYKKPKSYKIGKALRFKIPDLDEWIVAITKER